MKSKNKLLIIKVGIILINLFISFDLHSKAKNQLKISENNSKIEDLSFTNDSLSQSKSIWQKTVEYFRNANHLNPNKKFDFGIIPGPHYSSTAGLGLGIIATGTYSTDPNDQQLTRSNLSLYGDITTKGFMLVGLRGNHIFPKEKYRVDYRTHIYTFPTNYYGIGYEQGNNDHNKTDYRRLRFDAMVRFMVQIAPNIYCGTIATFKYVKATEIEESKKYLFQNQDFNLHAQTLGISFTYDSRDFILNASKGSFIQLDQTFTPRFLGNEYCFSTTDLTASTYKRVWQGGTLAGEIHSCINYGNPPWCMMSEVGNNSRMRGYYEGRYRDKHIIEGQIELRQHIKGRNGVTLWIGAAEVFHKMNEIRLYKLLPNAGLGYRWEFKNRINVRVDCGIGKNGLGFLFNINEAF